MQRTTIPEQLQREAQLAYWKKQLAALSPLALPTDHSRPVVQTYRGAIQLRLLPPTLSEQLLLLTQQENVTLFMLLLAGFQMLLMRYTGQRDICVGTPIANRRQGELEGMVGFFANTLVLRTDLSGNPTFLEVLRRVKRVCLEAYAHQDVSFEEVVKELEPERDLSRSPLVQVMLVLHNTMPDQGDDLTGVSMKPLMVESTTSKFDLGLSLTETGEGLHCSMQYCTDLFEAETITRMLAYWQTMLEGIIRTPQAHVSDMPLLTEEERHQLLVEWNSTHTDYPQDLCIHQLFEQQVEHAPDAVALVFEEETLTYADLNRRVNQLAHHLQEMGVGPEVLVGICMERSLEMVVGLLAVLKAGGAYVPLDPSYPKERLAFMVQDAHISVLLTQQQLYEQLPLAQSHIIALEQVWERLACESYQNPISRMSVENLAYIIYTSGSTGVPKGVQITHRGLGNLGLAQARAFAVKPGSRVLQFASLSFDASVWEILMALLAGASLHLERAERILPGPNLLHVLQEQAITAVTLPPSTLAVLPIEDLPALQTLVVAGEACPVEVMAHWALGRHFFNAYGPTEATVCASLAQCSVEQATQGSLSLGRPLTNIQLYVLDAEMQLVPLGVAGQLYIGGIGLARGYLHRPDLTAERFVPHPWSQEAGARFYRTGDLVRCRWDGTMEFLGRVDQQVKIRGYRIELGEIETVLRGHKAVQDCVVVNKEGPLGNERLVAYLIPQPQDLQQGRQFELWPSVAEFYIYDELLYQAMMNDERRNQSYRLAARKLVKDKVVLDIGTGSEAILAQLCVEEGARRVYAVEMLEDSYQKAKAAIEQLGLQDRIILIRGDVTQVHLPELVDVCISEIVGAIGGAEGAACILNDARRLLKDDGVLIPQRSTTYMAAVCLPEEMAVNPGFTDLSACYVEKIFEQVGYAFDLRVCVKGLTPQDLLSDVGIFEDLDFTTRVELEYEHHSTLTISRDGKMDGFLVWLHLQTVEDEEIDILEHAHSWLPVYFPMFYPAIDVCQGDRIQLACSSKLCENGLNLDYKVKGSVIRKNNEVMDFSYEAPHYEENFRASPFYQRIFPDGHARIKKEDHTHPMASVEALRRFLQQRMPDYMVPANFVFMDTLPLTPNGKVDRRALPAPEEMRMQDNILLAPRTAIEQELAAIWAEILHIEQVGIHDNFFELGGHSLLGMQLMIRLRDSFHVDLSIDVLFEKPILADLALVIVQNQSQESRPALSLPQVVAAPAQLYQPFPIIAVSREQKLPLSFAQQRLWFLDQLKPGSTAYLFPTAWHFSGPLHTHALQQSLQELVHRHESLRTTFEMQEGHQVQVIHAASRLVVPVVDLQELRAEHKEKEARWLIKQEAHHPCNLATGPLLRTSLLRLEPQEHTLLLTLHHIITDGWSNQILMRELSMLYRAFVAGQPSLLSPLPIQYADYALWQRQWLQGGVLEAQLTYWKNQLIDVPPLTLPTDHPRTTMQSYRGAVQSRLLPAALSDALMDLSRQQDVTLFMLLVAVLEVLLLRYTGQTDICVGIPTANRTQAEIEGLIGFFVNLLAIRVNLSKNPSFLQVLEQVRRVCLEAYTHQDIPFEKVVEELHPQRDAGRYPLFQVAIQLYDVMPLSQQFPELQVEPLVEDVALADFDLRVDLLTTEEGLLCTVTYDTNLFEVDTITRLLGHWQTLLQGIVANPQAHVSNLPLLTEEEQEQLLVEWNSTQVDYPQGQCVHQLFEQQVQRTPDAVALVFEDETLTYADLNRRANQLAHYLQSLGVGPEVLVGISLERCIQMIMGLLGVLKAGGAYVPLDSTYPKERLAFMVGDAQVSNLLTQQRLPWQQSPSQTHLIVLEEAWERLLCRPDHNPMSTVSLENVAYVIYTSGSTGLPKGVQVTHRGLGNLGQVQARTFAVGSQSHVLQFASLNFDASVSEILMALLRGASLHLERAEQLLPGPDLLRVLQEQTISLVTLPPSALAVLPDGDLPALQTLVVAGEACSVELMARWAVGRSFFNAYGPTEATVCASMAQCSANQPHLHSLSLGRPLANTQLYVLDRYLQPVPLGVPGEIYLGGRGLARGYLHMPELTGECFIPHPWSQEPGARLYRTGDRACYRPDGTLEFLGRCDQQIKLRGYRIELGEIEAILSKHPAVQECVVVKRDDPADTERLVAYAVTEPADHLQQTRQFELWPSVAEFYVYDELLYLAMINDKRRHQSYRMAARKLVKDKVVLDIGTGNQAILAQLCIEEGARRVYAVEMLETSYQQTRATIEQLGLQDRIVLLLGDVGQVHLPELADVCISEIVGPIGGAEGAASILSSVRHLLKEGGVMIPQRSTTQIAAVCLPEEMAADPGFTDLSTSYVEKIFEQVGYAFDLRVCVKGLTPQDLLSDVGVFEDLDFTTAVEREYDIPSTLTIQRDGRMNGFLIWLHLQMVEGEEIDILEHAHSWLPVYFPVFYPGIEVRQGERIELACSGRLCENGLNLDYKVQGSVMKKTGEVMNFSYEAPHYEKAFRASPFYQRIFADGHARIKEKEYHYIRPSIEALRNFLQERLPNYMVPSTFVYLKSLPLTPNGKVDRRALLAPQETQDGESGAQEGARTPIEELVMRLWSELLGRRQVGIHDNFFELGGHSLLATRVVSQVKARLRVEIPLRSLFETPTIAEWSRYIEETLRNSQTIEVPPLVPMQRTQELPLSFAQQRLWFVNQFQPESTAYVFPLVWRLCGSLDTQALEWSLQELVCRHESLRTTFTESMGQPVQVIHSASHYVLPVVDLQSLKQEQREGEMQRLVGQEAQRPCDLTNGPLMRASLLRLEEQEHAQLVIVHHIVGDGWSSGIYMREIAALYQAAMNGEPSPLPPLSIQYADYALWQRQWLQGEVLEELLNYWRQQLAGAPTVMNLPTDQPRSVVQTFVGAQQSLLIPSELLQQLKALSQREGATLFMTLLAPFNILLHYCTGQDDLVVGTDVANRNQVETEGLIGFFVNQLALRTDLAGNPSFLEVLHRVRKMSLEAYAHQDLPFERLIEELNPPRDLSRTPLFQVKFLLQNVPVQEPTLANLMVKPVEFYRGTSEFDLILNMSESDHKLFGRLDYRTDLFNAESMTRFLGHFETVLYQIVAHPSVRLDELEAVLAAADRRERNTREHELRQVSLQKLGQVRSKPRRRVH